MPPSEIGNSLQWLPPLAVPLIPAPPSTLSPCWCPLSCPGPAGSQRRSWSNCSSIPCASASPGATSLISSRTATSESSPPTGTSSASPKNSVSTWTSPARRSDPPSREGTSPDGATPMHDRFLPVLLALLTAARVCPAVVTSSTSLDVSQH